MRNPPIRVRVIEAYSGKKPELDYASSIRRVLESLPPEYVSGLEAVVLRDEASLSRKELREGYADARGRYIRPRHQVKKPWIELYVDNILEEIPIFVRRMPVLRYEVVHRILFHEIGHHLQATLIPKRHQPESGAWELADKMSRYSFRQRHPRLVPWARMARKVVNFLRRMRP